MRTRGRSKQQGAVAITVALCLVFLLGIGALAIDIGNVLVARNELQNAADAAAMAGAGCLIHRTACSNTTDPLPDWPVAATEASAFSTSDTTNWVQGSRVKESTVATGYWNATGTPYGLEPLPFTPGANDLPAVQVTIVKDGSNTNGSVPVFLGRVLGVQILKASAVATAVLSTPGNVGSGGLFPLAMSQCLYDNYWDSASNAPKLSPDNSTLPGTSVAQQQGQPYVFQIGSDYHYGACNSGQWTTFDQGNQSANYLRGLLTTGNTTTFAIGATPGTFIQSGTEDSLFNNTAACSAAGNGQCAWVTVPVVSDPVTTGAFEPVTAFACLHILDAKKGSQPYVLVQMSNDMSHCEAENSGGIGPNYGSYTPPRLVQ